MLSSWQALAFASISLGRTDWWCTLLTLHAALLLRATLSVRHTNSLFGSPPHWEPVCFAPMWPSPKIRSRVRDRRLVVLAAGCGSWALGQIGWTLAQFVPPRHSAIRAQAIFVLRVVPLGIAVCCACQTSGDVAFSIKHFCNLPCCFARGHAMIIAMWEPVGVALPRRSDRPGSYVYRSAAC